MGLAGATTSFPREPCWSRSLLLGQALVPEGEDGPCAGGSTEEPRPGRGGSRASQQPLPAPRPRCHHGVGDAGRCQGTDSRCCFICHPLVRDGQELSVLTCFSELKIGSGSLLGLG